MTRHAHDCRMAFGRLDPHCPRCAELKAGAPARTWAGRLARDLEARRLEEIRRHDCRRSKCGPVCTAFDW